MKEREIEYWIEERKKVHKNSYTKDIININTYIQEGETIQLN